MNVYFQHIPIKSVLSKVSLQVAFKSISFFKLLDILVGSLIDLKESFIFCGPHRGYHHPNYTHFSHYLTNPVIRLVNNVCSAELTSVNLM